MPTKKTPQDRKPKATTVPEIERPEDVEGFDLLKPIDEVPAWDQTPLLSLVAQLTEGANDAGDVELDNAQAVSLLGEIGRAMLPLAVDPKAFTKFASGKEALQRVTHLAIAWSAALGEDESSDDS